MKIAVVMSVWNRQALFDRTLETVARTSHSDVELHIVDDASEPKLALPRDYRFPIHARKVARKDKFWSCAAVPFNMAISSAVRSGADVVALQSPECLHVGDVLAHVAERSRVGVYLTYACFSTSKALQAKMNAESVDEALERVREVAPSCPTETGSDGPDGWFNHSLYRPCHLEFFAALRTEDMVALNGYDERFADGVACQDCDLLRRGKNAGMLLDIVDDPFVVHQWHYDSPSPYLDTPRFRRNTALDAHLRRAEPANVKAARLFTNDVDKPHYFSLEKL